LKESDMAKHSEAQADSEEQSGGKKPKGKLLVVVAAVVVLVLGGGAAAWFLLSGKPADHAKPAAVVPSSPPVFVTLEPFVVNLAGESERYVQVGIDLKVADSHVPDKIKEHMPEIRNGVLLLLSSKNAEELATLEGKNQLRQEIRGAVNTALGLGAPPPANEPSAAVGEAHASDSPAAAHAAAGALDVLLTSFVIQ
jgi:flagellar FliL protein